MNLHSHDFLLLQRPNPPNLLISNLESKLCPSFYTRINGRHGCEGNVVTSKVTDATIAKLRATGYIPIDTACRAPEPGQCVPTPNPGSGSSSSPTSSEVWGSDTCILHHVYLLLFIMFLSIIILFGVILMPFLS